jgi:hypothetical protein
MHPKSHCLTLGTACGHFDPALECLKKQCQGQPLFPRTARRGGGQKEHGGTGGTLLGGNKSVAEANSEGRW